MTSNPTRPLRIAAIGLIALGCLGFAGACLIGLVVVGSAFFATTGLIRSSAAYQQAVAVASADPQVVAALGEPIQTGWFTSGSISENGDAGQASLSIPLRGPRASGVLHVAAHRAGGDWVFDELYVTIGGQDIEIRR
jgi:hypothetical protein